jgi:hypothetical protein
MMVAPFKQRDIERAIRAACKAGHPPTATECHPDGRIILCFGGPKVEAGDALDQELEQWRSKHASS